MSKVVRGRPVFYTSEVIGLIASLIRDVRNLKHVEAILRDVDEGSENARIRAGYGLGYLGVSYPTLVNIAKKKKIKVARGRPSLVREPEKKKRSKKAVA
jgi:hypothetical protein